MKAPMTGKEFVEFHKQTVLRMNAICKAKNQDYSGGGEASAFNNFTMVEHQDICSTEAGFLVRMTDKMSRIKNLINNGGNAVKDESIADTLMDLANYSILMMGYIQSKNGTLPKKTTTKPLPNVGSSVQEKPPKITIPANNKEMLEKLFCGKIINEAEGKVIDQTHYNEGYKDGYDKAYEDAEKGIRPTFDPKVHVDVSVYGYTTIDALRALGSDPNITIGISRQPVKSSRAGEEGKPIFCKITPIEAKS